MKVLLVYSLFTGKSVSKPLSSPEEINFGISYVASLLEKNGHTVRLIVLSSDDPPKSINLIDEYITEFQPSLIGFSSVASEYSFIVPIADHVSEKFPEIYMIVGGPHVSLNPSEVFVSTLRANTIKGTDANDSELPSFLQNPVEEIKSPFDAVCIGEGEHAMVELVTQLESGKQPSGIPNLWIKNGDSIEKNANSPFLQDLDSLPFPNREIWFEWMGESTDSRFSILLGRGCPYLCTYCANHALRQITDGKYVRFRSPGNIVEEIQYLQEKYPENRDYFFEVETFEVSV